MPKTEIRHPDKSASTGAYSAGVAIDGWLYISVQSMLGGGIKVEIDAVARIREK